MRFSEKLPKLRKDNNLSQEQLADKLGVSRQAVSKWESGNSYPDMEKMLQMCKILNCHLEDIMDDGSIGNKSSNSSKNKIDLNAYMKDFLNFITKSYNMFCSMKFKQKIKCILEMCLIALILFAVSAIIHEIAERIIYGLIPVDFIWYPLSKVLLLMLIVFSIIIFIHLFKIRYLDYYITIEDQNATTKTIEEPIEKKEDKYYKEEQREKVIIRDPKHSGISFLEAIGKIIVFGVKVFAVFVAIPVLIIFVVAVGLLVASLYHIIYGILFLFIAIAILGAGLLLYNAIELLYNFIFSREQHFKRMFIIGIIGLVMLGLGLGLGACTYLNYETVTEYPESEYLSKTENIEMQDDLYISQFYKYEYVIDNSVNNLQIEIKYLDGIEPQVRLGANRCYIYYNVSGITTYNLVMEDVKDKKIRDYARSEEIKVTITLSQENYNKLKANYDKIN